jgi:glycosyltransferase involved in cell wall biosynthesis
MLGLTNDHFVIGTITRFYPVKNLAAQVHLVNQIKNSIPNLAYIIVAPLEGEHYHEISALIDSLNLRKYFHLLGFRRDISTLLSAFNIFVMTSLTEGTSIALLEAMQSGLPVIVSNVGGNRHIIQNGHNGFLFDLNDPHDLEKYTMHLYNNWPLCRLMGKNAAETAKTFSAESMVRKYHDEYCRLFSENEVSVAN